MARPRITPRARDDLRDIRNHSKAAFGARVARDYLDGLRETFSRLREHPLAGAAEDDLCPGLRGFAYRSHRVYYLSDANGILIIRILHHARDAAPIMRAER